MDYSIVQCLRKYFYWYFVKVSKGQGLPSLPGQLSHLRPRPPLSVCLLLSVFLLRTNRRLIVIVDSGPLPYVDTPLGSPSSPPVAAHWICTVLTVPACSQQRNSVHYFDFNHLNFFSPSFSLPSQQHLESELKPGLVSLAMRFWRLSLVSLS